MSIAEFAVKNKPVITQGIATDWAHLQMLGDTGIYYHSENALYKMSERMYGWCDSYNKPPHGGCYTKLRHLCLSRLILFYLFIMSCIS